MEHKIGEIFNIDNEWYQCIQPEEGDKIDCNTCDFQCSKNCKFSRCGSGYRSDKTSVIFKKLEKVGEPYMLENKKFQKYRVFHTPYIYNKIDCSWQSFADPYYIGLEVKQNKKEIMYIHKIAMNIDDRDYLLDKLESILHDAHCQQYKDEICEAFSKYITTENASDLKPFDLNAAKAGKPVCTRDGRKARIICFDRKGYNMFPIVALIMNGDRESDIYTYRSNGTWNNSKNESDNDLMMLPEKHEGWINICKNADGDYFVKGIFHSEELARNNEVNYPGLIIATTKIKWEE